MKTNSKWRSIGTALGVVLAGGLLIFTGAQALDETKTKTPPSLDKNAAIGAPARALSQAFEAAASKVKPAVVSVFSEKTVTLKGGGFALPFGTDFFQRFFDLPLPQEQQGPQQPAPRTHDYKIPQRGMGSGMILDKEGHILTNNHVVREVDEIKVQLPDKREFPAEVVATDAKTDIAIIRIKGKVPDNLPVVMLGDSEALKVGDWVLAIGAPFGLAQTVTAGIISATGRADVGIADYEDFLQSDAAINPGNSGGPLVNMDGEVIGMNTAIATNGGQYAGVGFAIPSSMVKAYLPTLVKGGSITRGFLGIGIQDVSEELAPKFKLADGKGALVTQVNKNSPADKAGLKPGDVIVRYQGKAVENARDLRKLAAATLPDAKADLAVMRDGKEKALTVNVGKMPEPRVASKRTGPATGNEPDSLDKLGLSLQPLDPDLAKQLGYDGREGIVVSGVEPGSPAARAGLQPGDLIAELNREPIRDVGQLRDAAAKSKDSLLLLVKRKDVSLFVVLHPS